MRYVLIFSLLLGLAACNGQKDFTPEDENGLQLANQVSIFELKNSQQQWILTAQAVDFADLQHATLKNPRLLLKKNGQNSAEISGDRGTFDYTTKFVSIEGHAQITALLEDAKLTTSRFFYDIDKDRLWADTKTVIVRGNAKTTARNGIETDSKLSKIELKQHQTRLPTDLQELHKK